MKHTLILLLSIFISACASTTKENVLVRTPQTEDSSAQTGTECKGFSMGVSSVKGSYSNYQIVIDKTCENNIPTWSFGLDGQAVSDLYIKVQSSDFPTERAAIERAITQRLHCKNLVPGPRGDIKRIRTEVIPLIESQHNDDAVLKLKEILLAEVPNCK